MKTLKELFESDAISPQSLRSACAPAVTSVETFGLVDKADQYAVAYLTNKSRHCGELSDMTEMGITGAWKCSITSEESELLGLDGRAKNAYFWRRYDGKLGMDSSLPDIEKDEDFELYMGLSKEDAAKTQQVPYKQDILFWLKKTKLEEEKLFTIFLEQRAILQRLERIQEPTEEQQRALDEAKKRVAEGESTIGSSRRAKIDILNRFDNGATANFVSSDLFASFAGGTVGGE